MEVAAVQFTDIKFVAKSSKVLIFSLGSAYLVVWETTGYVYSVKRVLTLGNHWVCVLC